MEGQHFKLYSKMAIYISLCECALLFEQCWKLQCSDCRSAKKLLEDFSYRRDSWTATVQSPLGSNIECLAINIQLTMVVNVYKLPSPEMSVRSLPPFTAPSMYAEDISCQHLD